MPILDIVCTVCTEALETHTEATCNSCGRYYHLNQRVDLPGRDCGQVWINEEHFALEFACNPCLTAHAAPGQVDAASLDDVLDASEAASVAGIAEGALVAAAEAGRVRHRRTGSGVYLFTRRDILAFASTAR